MTTQTKYQEFEHTANLQAQIGTIRDSCAAKADRIDRLGEQVVSLRAEVEQLRVAAQTFVQDYENGDMGDLKHYARAMRAALAKEKA
jgi:hypothetical protein